MQDAIKLFWWRGSPNFGDAIAPAIVSHVSGRRVTWSPRHEAELFSTGSIIDAALDLHNRQPMSASTPRPVVWGSGTLIPFAPSADNAMPPQVRLALVRGPLTALMLNWQVPVMGDPGLLVGELTGVVKSTLPRYRAGLVVHHSQKLQPGLPDRLVARGVTCIVGATDDYRSVAQQMAECEVILSSSLHGLVFADALGIPNTWMMPDGIHEAARFKFHDYACAIGRVLEPPVEPTGVGAAINALTGSQPAYFARIPAVIQSIKASFPASFRVASPVTGQIAGSGAVAS